VLPLRRKVLVAQSRMIRTALVLVVGVVTITGCNEQVESHYPVVAAAAQAGAFERGWLPAVLKPDVTDIREWHDVDTNEVRGRFVLNDPVLHRLQSDCKQATEVPRHIRSAPSWWPESIPGDEAATAIPVFRCGQLLCRRGHEQQDRILLGKRSIVRYEHGR
jgi:hypothetical protein